MSAKITWAREASASRRRMADEVRAGLLLRPLPSLPCKYFYDERGSELFEEITRLPEYYPTRTEEGILESIASEVIVRSRPRELCEIGSGIGRKVRLLLDEMRGAGLLERCLLLDISAAFLAASAQRLATDYPGLEVCGVVGDFMDDLPALGPGGARLVLFLAGTIGNLHPDEVPGFLRGLARQMEPADTFLVGVDLVKDPARLHAAYNDAAGVTAEFNRNILRVVNRELQGDFDPAGFEHVAFYDRERAWIEMRLRCIRGQQVRVAGLDLSFQPGDEIRTELSCKYTAESFAARLPGTGLRLLGWYTDEERLFASALLQRTADAVQPLP